MKKAPNQAFFLFSCLVLVAVCDIRYMRVLRQRQKGAARTTPAMIFSSALRGGQRTVTLPDGSTALLNAASTIAYAADMADGERTVELFGEAVFDVVAKPSRPFKVRVREIYIEVIGARFNVRNYPEETSSRTMVISGLMRVSYHGQVTMLHAGEEASVDPTQLSSSAVFCVKRGIDTALATEWTKGVIRFTDADLPSLLRDLSRNYDVDIQLLGRVTDHRFQGTCSMQEPLQEVLERLVVPYAHAAILRPEKHRLIITIKQ